MINTIIQNLLHISYFLGIIFLLQLSNMLFGLQVSLTVKNSHFDWTKIKKWLIKTICTIGGITTFSTAVTIFPFAVASSGITIPTESVNTVNFTLVLTTTALVVVNELLKAAKNYSLSLDEITGDKTENVSKAITDKVNDTVVDNSKTIESDVVIDENKTEPVVEENKNNTAPQTVDNSNQTHTVTPTITPNI